MKNPILRFIESERFHPLKAIWIGVAVSLVSSLAIGFSMIRTYSAMHQSEAHIAQERALVKRIEQLVFRRHEAMTRLILDGNSIAMDDSTAADVLHGVTLRPVLSNLMDARNRLCAMEDRARLLLQSGDTLEALALLHSDSCIQQNNIIAHEAGCADERLTAEMGRNSTVFRRRLTATAIAGGLFAILLTGAWLTVITGMKHYLNRSRNAETARRESETKYRTLIESLPHAVVIFQNGRIVFANHSTVEMIGYSEPHRLIGLPLDKLVAESDLERVMEFHRARMASRSAPEYYIASFRRANGEEFPAEVYVREVVFQGMPAFQAVVMDITERRQTERTLRESEERFRNLADSAPVLIWMAGVDRHTYYFNKTWLKFTGRSAAKEFGRGWTDDVYPADLLRVLSVYKNAFESRRPFSLEFRMMHADGTYHWLLDTGAPRFSADGSFTGFIGSCVDITDRKRSDHEVIKLSRAIECLPESVILTNLEGIIDYVNPAVLNLGGWEKASELIGTSVFAYSNDNGKRRLRDEILPELMRNGSWHGEIDTAVKNGATIPSEMICAVIPDETGKPAYLAANFRDISGRKRTERELARRAAELADANRDLEHFAYVATHDLQEPIRAMGSYAELLERRYSEHLDGDAQDFIRFISGGAERLRSMILDLLTYSRVKTRGAPFKPTDTEETLRQTLRDLNDAIEASRAEVTHDALPVVTADEAQLNLLLRSMIDNALKFRSSEPPQIHLSAEEGDQEWTFHIRDNGPGIDPRFYEQIFVIFKRLAGRDTTPGTGAGLAISKKIVERHGGRIWVESNPGQGSVFHFTLPKDPSRRCLIADDLPSSPA